MLGVLCSVPFPGIFSHLSMHCKDPFLPSLQKPVERLPLLAHTLLSLTAPKETELQLTTGTAELVTRDRGPQKRKFVVRDLDSHILDACPCQLTSHCLSRANPASATHKERFSERKRVMGREMSKVSGLQRWWKDHEVFALRIWTSQYEPWDIKTLPGSLPPPGARQEPRGLSHP